MFFGACYAPSSENFNNIASPDIPEVSYELKEIRSLNDIVGDTIKVFGYGLFDFEVESNINSFHSGIITIDSTVIERFNSLTNWFSIDLPDTPSGTYKLEIKTYFNTLSGSIADQLGSEFFEISQYWIIDFKNEPCLEAKFNEPIITDNSIIISWEQNEPLNHIEYRVIRSPYKNYDWGYIYYSDNAYENYFEVDDLPGGKFDYRVFTRCQNVYNNYGKGPWTTIDAGSINLKIQDSQKGFYPIYWNPAPIKKNFDTYSIESTFDEYEKFDLNTSSHIDTTSYIPEIIGSSAEIWINATTRLGETISSNRVNISHDDQFNSFDKESEFYYDKQTNNTFLITNSSIKEISTSNGEILRNLKNIVSPKATKDFFIGLDVESEINDEFIVRLDKNSFEIIDKLSKNQLFGEDRTLKEIEPSYQSNYMLVGTTDSQGNNPQVHYIDYLSQSIIASYSTDNIDLDMSISTLGNYYIVNYIFYEYLATQNSFTLYELDSYAEKYFFNSYQNEFYFVSATISAYSVFSKKRTSNHTRVFSRTKRKGYNESSLYFDRFSSTFLTLYDKLLYIIDLDNMKKGSVFTNNISAKHAYSNGYVYSSDGYKLEIELRD